jgi:hypothetical protein
MKKIEFNDSFKFENENTEIIKRLIASKVHVVCTANINESSSLNFIAKYLDISPSQLTGFCKLVNEKKDPGCLYPKYTLTLFPEENSGADLSKCVEETLNANETYFQSEEMYYIFDKKGSDLKESGYLQKIETEMEKMITDWKNKGKIKHLKKHALYFSEKV